MKIFTEEEGKKVVYVQYEDLRLLYYNMRTPKNIKNLISLDSYSSLDVEKYLRFDNEELIEFLENTYFILDFDKFVNMSEKEIYDEYILIENRIKKVLIDLKKFPKKERKNQTGLYQAYDVLSNYRRQILQFLESELLELPNGKKYIYKNNAE